MKEYFFEEDKINELSEDDKIYNIYNGVVTTKVNAEIDKLDIEENKLNSQNFLSKIFGKLDGSTAFKKDNISFAKFVVNDKLNSINKNTAESDLHSILADIEIFMEDNKSNSSIENEISELNKINNYVYNNFEIDNELVNKKIIDRKQCFLPVLTRKLTKNEILKQDTIKYLNKQGYTKK